MPFKKTLLSFEILAVSFIFSLTPAVAASDTVTVKFPTDRETGDIIAIKKGSNYSDRHSPGNKLASASGLRQLPRNVDLGYICRDQSDVANPLDVLSCFPANQLTCVVLKNAVFENKSISKLLKFKNLRRIELTRTDVDDEAVAKLAGLPLETLAVDRCKVTGSFLTALAANTRIEHLDIDHNDLDLNYLQELENFPKLRSLNLSCVDLKDKNLAAISKLTSLEILDLTQNQALTSASIPYLRKLPKLRDLSLEDTGIKPNDLAQLKGLPLRFVHLDEKQKAQGISSLHKAFPELQVLVEHTEQRKYGILGNIDN